ncbi:hypothetical protein F5X99DRAFT_428992 [Biscogniauxia marginata]|nr:hypothetical protein F5X99DRAFT_428992 [Biscogniauxia marginata]
MIWEFALLEESSNRLVLLHEIQVIPLKRLVSPFLMVNVESRYHARAFYNVAVSVHAIRPPGENQTRSHPPRLRLPILNEFRDPTGEIVGDFGDDEAGNKGLLYLSPQYDTFVAGKDFCTCNRHVSYTRARHRYRVKMDTSFNGTTAPLSRDACRAVSRLLLVQASLVARVSSYLRDQWPLQHFPGVQDCKIVDRTTVEKGKILFREIFEYRPLDQYLGFEGLRRVLLSQKHSSK